VKPFYLSGETVLPIKPFYLSNATCTATSRMRVEWLEQQLKDKDEMMKVLKVGLYRLNTVDP
jgi:hypothetical protein